jgi:hypothetical protein
VCEEGQDCCEAAIAVRSTVPPVAVVTKVRVAAGEAEADERYAARQTDMIM